MKKQKIVLNIIVLLLVLLVVVVAISIVISSTVIKGAIEGAASLTLDVPVLIKDIHLSILDGSVGIRGLVIKNPPGYANETLLELDEAAIKLDIRSLFSNRIDVKQIKLDGAQLTVEQKGLTNNLKEVLDKLSRGEATEKSTAEQKGKDLHISRLEITNTRVNVKLLPMPGKSDTVSLNIDPIIMTDLGTDKRLKMGELVARIMSAMAAGVAKQGVGVLPDDMVKGIDSASSEIGKAISEQSGKAVEETKKAVEGLKSLFGGKKE